MSREKITTTIEGFDYEVYQVGAKDGRKLVSLLGRLETAGDGNWLFGKEDDLEVLYDRLIATCYVRIDGKLNELGDVFDEHFKGRYAAMLLWLKWAAGVNVANFLSMSPVVPPAAEPSK